MFEWVNENILLMDWKIIYIYLQAFMRAWVAACHWKGSATLLIPAGTFLIGQVAFQGPCSNPTPMIVEIRGTLKAQTDISEFPSPEWVSFESINGLVVTGGGTLDGQGGEDWQYNDCHHNSNCQLLPTVSYCNFFSCSHRNIVSGFLAWVG